MSFASIFVQYKGKTKEVVKKENHPLIDFDNNLAALIMNKPSLGTCAFFLLLVLASCAPLTKSQVTLSHNYFKTIANYPSFHRQLNTQVAKIQLEAKNLESSLQESDSQRVAMIISSIRGYEKQLELPDTIAADIKFVENYVQEYYVFLPNGFNLYQAIKGTTETISGMFGLGGLAKSLLPNNVAGLTTVKKKRIKNHIVNSEKQLLQSLLSIQQYVNTYYLPKIDQINTGSIEDFEELLIGIKDKPDALAYYMEHNRMLTEFYQNLYLTRGLAQNLSKSIDPFIRSEKHIIKMFVNRQKIDPETVHLNELVRDISRIKNILIDLETK